jgi:zinc transporter 7
MTPENGQVIGLAILAGFVVFLLFDIIVRSSHGHDCHDHSHSLESENNEKKKKFVFSSAVILNLAADSLHNFTDGIAIGASFAGTHHDTSLPLSMQIQNLLKSQGGLASLAVLFHEIPHELGDYSILVSAGMTKNQAILAQFSTAIAAYCGTFVGLFGMQTMKDYLGDDLMVPFTAGGFIYLAAVTILPGLLEERVGKRARIVQVMAFLTGIGFMYGVALLEHAGGGCGHGHASHGHGAEMMHHGGHDHQHSHILHNEHLSHNHMHKNEAQIHVEDHHGEEEENEHRSHIHIHDNGQTGHSHAHHDGKNERHNGYTHDNANDVHAHAHRDNKEEHNSGNHHEEHHHNEF